MSRRLLVLGYHNVEPTWAFAGSSAAAGGQGLERHLRLLRRWARVLPLRDALAALAEGRPLPSRAVCLTFDDGYRDNLTRAAPLLSSYGLPATFFLVPGFLSGQVPVWWEQLGWAVQRATARDLAWQEATYDLSTAALRAGCLAAVSGSLKAVDQRRRLDAVQELTRRLAPAGPRPAHDQLFLDWRGARQLLDAGFDVGSHTCGHPILSQESAAEQARELSGSRQELQARLGRTVDVVAYPNGRGVDYDERTLAAVRDAGYRYAVTTRTGLAAAGHPSLEVRRAVIGPETDLRGVLRGGLRAVRQAGRDALVAAQGRHRPSRTSR